MFADSSNNPKKNHLSPVTCPMSPVTCHLTTTLCRFSCYESPRRFGHAAAGGFVNVEEKFIIFWPKKIILLSVLIQAIYERTSLTRSLYPSQMKITPRKQTDNNFAMDIATYRLNQPRGQIIENFIYKQKMSA